MEGNNSKKKYNTNEKLRQKWKFETLILIQKFQKINHTSNLQICNWHKNFLNEHVQIDEKMKEISNSNDNLKVSRKSKAKSANIFRSIKLS